jgi:hypothetical protein
MRASKHASTVSGWWFVVEQPVPKICKPPSRQKGVVWQQMAATGQLHNNTGNTTTTTSSSSNNNSFAEMFPKVLYTNFNGSYDIFVNN